MHKKAIHWSFVYDHVFLGGSMPEVGPTLIPNHFLRLNEVCNHKPSRKNLSASNSWPKSVRTYFENFPRSKTSKNGPKQAKNGWKMGKNAVFENKFEKFPQSGPLIFSTWGYFYSDFDRSRRGISGGQIVTHWEDRMNRESGSRHKSH